MNVKYINKCMLVILSTSALFITSIASAEDFEGILSWSKRVELSTPVNGMVQKVFSKPGNIAAKGEVLVQLDPRIFKADLKFAKAKLKNANELNLEAKRELDRQTDMYDRTMLSEHDLQLAKNNLTTAHSGYRQAEASLTKAKLNLEYSAIRAPFNAIVIRTKAVEGQVVASQITPPVLVIVAEASRMIAKFYIASNKINDLVVNQGVKIDVANQIYQGKILTISLEPDKLKKDYYAVDVIFDTKGKVLRAGQKATVSL